MLLLASGGTGNSGGQSGQEGTITGKECPKGLYGTFCEVCVIWMPPFSYELFLLV